MHARSISAAAFSHCNPDINHGNGIVSVLIRGYAFAADGHSAVAGSCNDDIAVFRHCSGGRKDLLNAAVFRKPADIDTAPQISERSVSADRVQSWRRTRNDFNVRSAVQFKFPYFGTVGESKRGIA